MAPRRLNASRLTQQEERGRAPPPPAEARRQYTCWPRATTARAPAPHSKRTLAPEPGIDFPNQCRGFQSGFASEVLRSKPRQPAGSRLLCHVLFTAVDAVASRPKVATAADAVLAGAAALAARRLRSSRKRPNCRFSSRDTAAAPGVAFRRGVASLNCPRHFFSSHSTQSTRPADTGKPHASHLCRLRNTGGTWL